MAASMTAKFGCNGPDLAGIGIALARIGIQLAPIGTQSASIGIEWAAIGSQQIVRAMGRGGTMLDKPLFGL